jgi:hypothetical protein
LHTGIPYIIGLSPFQVKKHIKHCEGNTSDSFSIEAILHVSNVPVVDPITGCVIGYLMCFTTYRNSAFTFIKLFLDTMFTAGNHVRLNVSIWKMGPKSGSLEK